MSSPIGRLLGIDHGIKRIGLAMSDALRITAAELTIINRTTKEADFVKINHIVQEYNVVGIILGMPNDTSAPAGTYTQADTVKLWAERFQTTTNLPILFWDEQLTSEEAKELAIQKKRKPRDPIDDLAARIILQSYLDAYHDGLAPPVE